MERFYCPGLLLESGSIYDTFGQYVCLSQVTDTLNPETSIFNMNRLEQIHLGKFTAKIENSPPF